MTDTMKITIEGTPEQIAEVMKKLQAQPQAIPVPYIPAPQVIPYIQPAYPDHYYREWIVGWDTSDLSGVKLNPTAGTAVKTHIGDIHTASAGTYVFNPDNHGQSSYTVQN